jgi:hypothetical protein
MTTRSPRLRLSAMDRRANADETMGFAIRLTRRRLMHLTAAAGWSIILPARTLAAAVAHDAASPVASPLGGLAGYLELRMTATDTVLALAEQVAAGRYLVTVKNQATLGESAPAIVLIAEGATIDELLSDVDPDTGLAPWFYTATFVGAPIAPVGTTAQAIVDLAVGRYAVIGEAFQPAVELEVVPGSGASPLEPVAESAITMGEGALSGVPEQVTPGQHLWRITSVGAGPHRFQLYSYPEPVTLDQLLEAATLPEGATPPPGVPDLARLQQLGGLGVLSSGRTAWAVVDLVPGAYIALCPVPDADTGVQDFLAGEVVVFTVGSPASGTPTPRAGG